MSQISGFSGFQTAGSRSREFTSDRLDQPTLFRGVPLDDDGTFVTAGKNCFPGIKPQPGFTFIGSVTGNASGNKERPNIIFKKPEIGLRRSCLG